MRSKFLVICLLIMTGSVFSQISFEKGYIINNDDQKFECFIKNRDWKNNPNEFEYKLSEDGEPKKGTLNNVKEFGVSGKLKYSRYKVKIDQSSESINNLSKNKEPNFIKKNIFLKFLVEGKASLLLYEQSNLKRYFFKVGSNNVEQLVFKSYLLYPNYEKYNSNKVGENNQFRQQLWSNFKCESIKLNYVENINYKRKDLVNFFIKYNKCNEPDYITYDEYNTKDWFNLFVRPGVNSVSCSIDNNVSGIFDLDTEYNYELVFRFGVEAEVILPFNKNKWAIIIEPTYQYFKSEKEIIYLKSDIEDKRSIVEMNYSSVEAAVGLRHYMFLNKNSKLFVNAVLILDSPMSKKIYAEREEGTELIDLEINSRMNFAFGVGYNYRSKVGLELRLGGSRELLNNQVSWHSDYKSTSLILGYKLF